MYIVHVMSKSAAQAVIRAKERGSTHTYIHCMYNIMLYIMVMLSDSVTLIFVCRLCSVW